MSEESSISKQRLIALVLGPMAMLFLLMLSAPEGFTPEVWKLVALAAWMIIWWMTEAIPIPVTALLPIPMMPLLAIAPQKTVAASYGHPLIFLFLGGFMIAAAMQRWGLHRRIALRIVKAVGTSPQGIIGGFMVATVNVDIEYSDYYNDVCCWHFNN